MTAAGSAGRWLSIVGIGEDGIEGLSPAARSLIAQAELVVGGKRHLALAGTFAGEALTWPSPPDAAFPAILARRGTPVCVLASGDPFFYGIGSLLLRHVAPTETICLAAPSAFSLAAARLLLGPEAIIGVTCVDSLERALAAAAGGASYVAFGAFNASRTKPDAPRPPPSLLGEAKARLKIPICAIGGINIGNAAPLVAAGADYLAAIDGIFAAPDIGAAVRDLKALFPV